MSLSTLMHHGRMLRSGRDIGDHLAAVRAVSERERAVLCALFDAPSSYKEEATSHSVMVFFGLASNDELFAGKRRSLPAPLVDLAFESLASRPEAWLRHFVTAAMRRSSAVPFELLIGLDRWLGRGEWSSIRNALREFSPDPLETPLAHALWVRDRDRFVDEELWGLLADEGGGSEHYAAAIARLVAVDPALRVRTLDAALGGLLRDLSAYDVRLHIELVRMLAPTVDEVARRVFVLAKVLATAPGTAVTLAQEQLSNLVALDLDPGAAETVIAASSAVFARTDKKTVMAQLTLLARLAEARPDLAPAVVQRMRTVLNSAHADIVLRAQRILDRLDPEEPDVAPGPAVSATVRVPLPRTAPIAAATVPDGNVAQAVVDADELAELFAGLLVLPSPASAVVRAVEGVLRLSGQSPTAAAALRAQAMRVVRGIAVAERLPEPRRHLAWIVLAWLGVDAPPLSFLGELVTQDLDRDPTIPEGFTPVPVPYTFRRSSPLDFSVSVAVDAVSRSHWQSFSHETGGPVTVEFRETFLARPSWSPSALYMLWLDEVAVALSTRSTARPIADALARATGRESSTPAVWARVAAPGVMAKSSSDVIGHEPIVWIDHSAARASLDAILDAPFDLSDVAREFAWRVEQARWAADREAILDWWVWLYGHHLDHLAAQTYPTMWVAAQFDNVRTAPILRAIGQARTVLAAPSYCALALGLSDVAAGGRAVAAEAVGSLCTRGLFAPLMLAEELSVGLLSGTARAGRVAGALDDASQLSAIAGWRVLEVLLAVVPTVASVTGASRLVALAARLAIDYGVDVELDPRLAARAKGSGPMAAAVRSLRDGSARETRLARDAAAQAAAARDA